VTAQTENQIFVFQTRPATYAADVPVEITIIVPVFNEAANVQPLARETAAALAQERRAFELVFVDDGSTDGSRETIRKIQASDPSVRYIIFRRNFGKSAALAAGMLAAHHEIVATMDADLQDSPEQLPLLLGKLDEGYDLVSGWRYDRKDRWTRRMASRIYNWTTSLLTGVKLHDINCGFKCYRRDVLKEVKIYGERHRFIPVLASYRGFRLGEIRIEHFARTSGRSRFGWERILGGAFSLLSVILMNRYTNKPLHFFGVIGVLLSGLGSAVIVYLLADRILFHQWLSNRPLFMLGCILLVIGVQIISFGLLAEMVAFSYRRENDYSISESSEVPEVPAGVIAAHQGGGDSGDSPR